MGSTRGSIHYFCTRCAIWTLRYYRKQNVQCKQVLLQFQTNEYV